MQQEIIIKKGPKSQEEKQALIKQIMNKIVTGEIHEKTITENANNLNISRYTFREYLPLAYSQLEIKPEIQIKKAKDTRQFLIDSLMNDFKRCDDPTLRSVLSRNISSLLDSQEKSSMLIMQYKGEDKKDEVQTAEPGLFSRLLNQIDHNVKMAKKNKIIEV